MSNNPGQDLFASAVGRRCLFGLLYLSEGAPMGFIWWALPSQLTGQGIALAEVASLSALLTLPWTFKFIVGPVIDYGVAKGMRLRSIILACQAMMGLTLLMLAPLDWVSGYATLTMVLFMHGCFAASQDVGIDTLAIKTIPADELGRINGWMQAGMLGGRALAAVSVVTLLSLGYQTGAIIFVITLIWLPMLALYIARPNESSQDSAPSEPFFTLHNWRKFITASLVLGLWVALTVGAGFEFFTISVGPFLQQLGGTERDISLLFGIAAPAGLAAGALGGGYFAANRNARVATAAGIGLVALGIIFLATLRLSSAELSPVEWLLPVFLIYIATGFLTAASYTLLMQLSRGRYAATRFAVFMSATNGCEVWISYLGGRLTTSFSYAATLLLLLPISLLAAPALIFLARHDQQPESG